MDSIGIGKTVAIKTNNGEEHSAYISSINNTTQLVTLVWFQDGMTDTKEISISEVLNEPVIINKGDKSEINLVNLPEFDPDVSKDDKIFNEIEEFKSDTKIDTHPTNRPASCCSVLINELQENGNLFNNMQMSYNNNNMDDNLDEEEEEDFIIDNNADNKSIHSCHCPESQMSLKSKISVNINTSSKFNKAASGLSAIKSTQSKSIAFDNDTVLKTKSSDADKVLDKIEPSPAIDNAISIQESLKYILQKREDEQKKIQSNQKLKRKKNKLETLDLGDPSKDILAMIRECKMALQFEPLNLTEPAESHSITVCVRKRPLTHFECVHNDIDIVSIPNKELVIVHELKSKVNLKKYLEHHKFRFDYGFDETCNNEIVYNYTAKPLINTLFNGGMATCFAYGQTGAGKTHTVGGNYKNGKTTCEDGICALAAKDVFKRLNGLKHNSLKVSASFYEIYNGKVYDLLSDKQLLSVLEDGNSRINIVGLTEKVVTQYEDVLHLIEYGNNIRSSGETSANKHSSRSHAVFQLILRPEHIAKIYGKFSFIDLAGNERGCDSISTNRYEMVEAAGINTSLLALKECIRAMGKNRAHLPFRASKLTQVLKDSFVARNSKTCMIAMISPGITSCQYTLNTLRYADRVKELAIKDIIKKHKKSNVKQSLDNVPVVPNFIPRI